MIDAAFLRLALARARRTIDRHAAALTRLDAVLGDGDHGDNLSIGFRAVEELIAGLPPETLPGDLLRSVGHCLISAVGGASGPLYGTAFIEAGFRAGDADVIDAPLAASMLEAATDGLARRGRCAVGDKTILDTLEPAATALAAARAGRGRRRERGAAIGPRLGPACAPRDRSSRVAGSRSGSASGPRGTSIRAPCRAS